MQKKSLISNRSASKKAIVTKRGSTKVQPTPIQLKPPSVQLQAPSVQGLKPTSVQGLKPTSVTVN